MAHIFTSDLHLGHANIISYCSRPFSNVDEMNQVIIDRWNEVVGPADTVWCLGDFAFLRADPKTLRRLFSQLQGSKHLIAGNHDGKSVRELGWSSVRDYAEIVVDKTRIVLSHYSMRTWNGMRHGSVQLYGHSHGALPGTAQCVDVGVDAWDFRPVTWPQITARLATLPALAFDGDGARGLLDVEGAGGEVPHAHASPGAVRIFLGRRRLEDGG
jgi:calcineurin-like phosphoesterase family protein